MSYNPFLQQPEDMERAIQEAMQATPGAFAMGVITSTTNGLYAQIEKTPRAISLKCLASYTPAVGHRVLIAKISSTFVVLGRVV